MIIVGLSMALSALLAATLTRQQSRRVEPVGAHTIGRVEPQGPGGRRRVVNGAGLFVVLLLVLSIDIVLAIGMCAAAFGWPRLRKVAAARRKQRAIEQVWPDAIEMLVLVIHAGMTPHQAIAVLAARAPEPTRFAFVEVRRRVTRGATLADALLALPELLGSSATAVADTLAIAERHGAPIARTLEQLGHDVRERRRRDAEAHARTLPVKMSFPLVACTLPAFVLISIVPAVLAALRSLGGSGL